MLKTKNAPGEIRDFEDFAERALSFDFYTDMSDDHRVYQSGRRAREIMDDYAAKNPLAKKLWDRMCQQNLESFMAGQLINYVTEAVLSMHKTPKAAQAALSDFVIPYLANVGKDTMLGRAVREAIAKKVGAPPSYAYREEDKALRESMIDDFIANYERKHQ